MSPGQLLQIWRSAKEKRIYDYLDVDENRNLSESWTGFYKIHVIEGHAFERV